MKHLYLDLLVLRICLPSISQFRGYVNVVFGLSYVMEIKCKRFDFAIMLENEAIKSASCDLSKLLQSENGCEYSDIEDQIILIFVKTMYIRMKNINYYHSCLESVKLSYPVHQRVLLTWKITQGYICVEKID